MTFIEIIQAVPKLYNWYSKMTPIKQIRFNYIVLLTASWGIMYYNDYQHRQNNDKLTSGLNTANNLRSKDQERYTTKLEAYSDKFQSFSEKLLQQEQELKQIKKDQ